MGLLPMRFIQGRMKKIARGKKRNNKWYQSSLFLAVPVFVISGIRLH